MTHNKKYGVKQQIQMVLFCAETKSILLTRAKFVKHFNLYRKHGKPSKQTILPVVNKFLKTGSVLEVPQSGRQKAGRSTANTDTIRRAILKSSQRSIRRLSAEHKVKRSTVHSMLQKDFKKFPCKMLIW